MINFPLINNSPNRYMLRAKPYSYAMLSKSPTFTSCYGIVKDSDGNFLYKINSALFRTDLMWDDFTDFLLEKYKNEEKINLVCHACSEGYEAYSLAAVLKAKCGDAADKFMPVKAKDIYKPSISVAKTGLLDINMAERMYADYCMDGKFLNYFKKLSGNVKEEKVIAVDELRQNIQFEQSNIMNDIKEISKDNTVLMFRNAWPYLDTKDIVNLAKLLAANMKNNSLLVIGEFDKSYGVDKLLETFGFKETHIFNVYEPPGNSIKTKIRANKIARQYIAQLPPGKLCSVCEKHTLKNIMPDTAKQFTLEA